MKSPHLFHIHTDTFDTTQCGDFFLCDFQTFSELRT